MIRNPDGGDWRESIRANRCDEEKLFSERASDSRELPQTSDLQFLTPPPRSPIRKEGVQFRNPETIRENQAIRANLRIDLRESGHLSSEIAIEFWHSRWASKSHIAKIDAMSVH